ncbi:MAG: hypothetical protein JW891_16730 [Candidatus Lokiarchaeota archaeon]|nr:hypothetical protein [Candidatus Lokiarchaeota archaeon]
MTELDNLFEVPKVVLEKFKNVISEISIQSIDKYSWRKDKTPYKVLISEYFLTRTKAAQVEPIFIEFIKKYPSIEHLSNMKIKTGRKLMGSLGLHKRVDMLKRLAEQIQQDFNGEIPKTYKQLKSLMGIGKYTANAILCFAFGEKRPLLDNNIVRLFERFFNISSIKSKATNDNKLWEFAEQVVPENDYVNFNYGLLDLSIELCTPKKPKCENCPLTDICNFYNL